MKQRKAPGCGRCACGCQARACPSGGCRAACRGRSSGRSRRWDASLSGRCACWRRLRGETVSNAICAFQVMRDAGVNQGGTREFPPGTWAHDGASQRAKIESLNERRRAAV
eukprot:2076554-Prymnesium_polylepis.1